jgi:EmrB/QacA subfamily drug resistance transporter
VFTLVSVGTFMTTVDASIVNIGLPAIARSFDQPVSGAVEWVIIAYLLVIAGTLLGFARAADLVSRGRIWTLGVGIFTIGSLLCGLAPSLALLVAARAVQGVGGAMIFAPALVLVVEAFPRSERGRALGLNAVIVSLGVSTGPTLGGLITEHLSWRWIFFVNLPLGIVGYLSARRILPFDRPAPAHVRFDRAGALAFGVGLAMLLLGLSFGSDWGWTSWRVLGALVVAVVAFVVAVRVELHRPDPLVDVRLLGSRVFGSALAAYLFSVLALFAVGFLMPFYFEELRGFDPLHSGMLLTPYSLALAAVAPFSGRLADRFGSRLLAPLGLSLAAAGLFLLAQIDTDSSAFDVCWRLAVSGIGQALFVSPNTRTIMNAAPPERGGTASGLIATSRVVGQSLSVAVAGAVFIGLGGAAAAMDLTAAREDRVSLSPAQFGAAQATFLDALHTAMIVCGALAALGIVVSLIRIPKPAPEPEEIRQYCSASPALGPLSPAGSSDGPPLVDHARRPVGEARRQDS